MKNDEKILDLVRDLMSDCISFVETVKSYGNQCAQTDRMLEEILKTAGEIKKLYDTQTPEAEEEPIKIYKHINDCWRALEKCESIEEVWRLFKEFPRWSGDWDWFYDNGDFCVRNDYPDGTDDHEIRKLDNLSCEDEVWWEIIYNEKNYNEEKTIRYDDPDDARADFLCFTQEEPQFYNYVILRKLSRPSEEEEPEITKLDTWNSNENE